MITELIELLELIRKLVQRKGELNKEYFEAFIQPMWTQFNVIHEDYKKSFQGYSSLLVENGFDIDELIEKIRQDSIYTSDLRDELYALLEAIWDDREMAHLEDFLDTLRDYFSLKNNISIQSIRKPGTGSRVIYKIDDNQPLYEFINNEAKERRSVKLISKVVRFLRKNNLSNIEIVRDDTSNAPRYRAIIGLSRNRNYDQKTVYNFFEIIVKDIQYRYGHVAKAYYNLRANLLR